jgi:hypothetical protein
MKVGIKTPNSSTRSICAIALTNFSSSLARETTPTPTGNPSTNPIGKQPIGVPAIAGAIEIQDAEE